MQLECMRFTPDSAMGPSVELSKPWRRSAERLGALRAMIDNSNPGEPDANRWDEAARLRRRPRRRDTMARSRPRAAISGADGRLSGQRLATGHWLFCCAVSEGPGRTWVRRRRECFNRIP